MRFTYLCRTLFFHLSGVSIKNTAKIGRGVFLGKGVVIGADVQIGDRCSIKGLVKIEDRVKIDHDVEIYGNVHLQNDAYVGSYSSLGTTQEGYLEIGERVLVNSFSVIGAGSSVIIEDDCIFAPYVQVTDSTHPYELISDSPRHGKAISSPVKIGKGSWLGSAVKVLMGVEIGHGSIIGAGSVVNKSLSPFSISAGMPAKVIRYRKET